MRVSVHLHTSSASRDAAQTSRGHGKVSVSDPDQTAESTDNTSAPSPKKDDSKSDFYSLLHKYHSSSSDSSDDDDSGTTDSDSDSQDSSKQQDSSRVLTVPVHGFQPLHELLPLIAQNPFTAASEVEPSTYTTEDQAEPAGQTSAPSSSSTPQVDPQRPAPAPMIEENEAPSAPSSAPVAFAAKLTPDAGENTTSSPSTPQTAQSASNPAPQKQPATSNAASDDPDAESAKATTDAVIEKIVKVDAPAPATPQSDAPSSSGTSIKKDTPEPNATAAARMEPLVEAPAAPAGSNHDITVRIPDATERAMNVRFLERGGEIHVSVRTADADTAQSLRTSLSDFVSRMDHAGIRAEVWRPGADASASQNNSQNQSFSEQREQKRNQSGAQEREDKDQQQSSKPKWVEALEKAGGQAA